MELKAEGAHLILCLSAETWDIIGQRSTVTVPGQKGTKMCASISNDGVLCHMTMHSPYVLSLYEHN